MKHYDFDVIVVGAGHAGIEACLATSRLGLKTLVITTNISRIGYMSCNPSIGGLAKGHMVREIDVMGGEMGRAADGTCIQYKRLNSTKGPAVRGTRMQSDKEAYCETMSNVLLGQRHLTVREDEVKALLLESNVCEGVVVGDGSKIRAKSVIITAGTFLNGVMHVGLEQQPGGRVGDKAAVGLSDQLREYGFTVQRLKTGTPARLYRDSIDFSKTEAQSGDVKTFPFSFRSAKTFPLPQVQCFISRTTEKTHDIIRANLDKSPMYCGLIEGVGPRYCPSIEDKVTRFADRDSHQTFLEPESLRTDLIYLQGISTSLPADVQMQFLQTIPGLENVRVARFGYAVEYDFFTPDQIWHRLETRPISRLFLAGQINGTSGYEEAAAQGFVAGVNCARMLLGKEELVLGRDEAYIGVMIDDLVTKSTREPYRMFTSRAEHRLVLREDNTIDRLIGIAELIGLHDSETLERAQGIKSQRSALLEQLKSKRVNTTQEVQEKLRALGSTELLKSVSLEELSRRSEISYGDLVHFGLEGDWSPDVAESVEIEVKYAGYVKRQMELISQAKRMEELVLPANLNYQAVRGLSSEESEKLSRVQPRTLGQAQRISGVNPSAVQAIMVHLKGNGLLRLERNGEQKSRDQKRSYRSGRRESLADSRMV